METHKYQPRRYTGGPGVYGESGFDEHAKEYPFFDEPRPAVDYMVQNKIFGCVQRFSTWPAQAPDGPEPDSGKKFSWWLTWKHQQHDYLRGFHSITAGVVWVSKDAPVMLMTDITTSKIQDEYGTWLEEIPGAFDKIMSACEAMSEGEALRRS